MRIAPFLLSFNFLFAYNLVVYSQKDAIRLNEIGFICQEKNKKYICLDSNDLDELKRIRDFLANKFNITTYIENSNQKSKSIKKIVKTVKTTKSEKEGKLETFYSIQLGSFRYLENAKKVYEKAKSYPFARIEKIGEYYVVRIEKAKNRDDLKFKNLGMVKKCYIIKDRIIESNFKMSQ